MAAASRPAAVGTRNRNDRAMTRHGLRPSQPVASALRATDALVSRLVIGSPLDRSAARSHQSEDRKLRHGTPSAPATARLEADRLSRSTGQIVKTP